MARSRRLDRDQGLRLEPEYVRQAALRPERSLNFSMRFVRTILAFTIAVSLAMLPLGASAAGRTMAPDDMKAAMQMADHADMSMDDCCPDDMRGMPLHKDGYKCGMGFCCVGGALALGHVRPLILGLVVMPASTIAIPADQVVLSRSGSPPFRPPRI